MRNKAFAALLGLLLPALLGAQEVRVSRVARTVAPIVQPSAMAASAVLATPSLLPTTQPSLLLVNPLAAPLALPAPAVGLRPVIAPITAPAAVSAASAAAAPVALPNAAGTARVENSQGTAAPGVRAQAQAVVQEVSQLAKAQAGPSAQNAAISKVFDNAGSAPAVAVDYPGVPNESLQGADRSVVEALRSFRKELKIISHAAPLKKADADFLIKKALALGVPIRIHASDLQAENNHWERGPHIHIGSFHIPVVPGYMPELVPGFTNPN